MPGENQIIPLAIIEGNVHMCAIAQTSLFKSGKLIAVLEMQGLFSIALT
jgi:hypothetical protein